MKFSKLVLSGVLGIALLSATSCGTPKNVAYFQDLNNNPDTVITLQNRVITVKPTDKIYIGVKSKDPQISQLFNLTGGTSSGATNMSQDAYYYTVDSKGDIDFPVVGKIQVAGLTREEIAEKVKKSLVDASLVKDPTITVSLSNLHYSMMGEVAKPGQYAIEEEKVTILDAISKAGDLTIQGKRNDVMVLRQENGHQKIYKINLCSGRDIFNSPAYYLQQNDVVYVTPNDTKKRSSTLNGNTVQSTGFWMSISSLIVTILTFLKVN
ncbi:polysaccharide biosynthesis/export family protein [Segatella copri]|uniref:polysaccharide biosynthesis/export family protein n=1 Tax=Segatella copri TaxID=165179 RepID=UPI003D048091